VYAVDVAFIDLRSDHEGQAYALIKDRVFANTKKFDQDLLEKQVWTPSSIPFGKL
jgi:hypothetical protein